MARGVPQCALLAAVASVAALLGAVPASAETTSETSRVQVSDGVTLAATVTGEAPLAPKPVIVEFSPYGRDSGTVDAGPAYNYLLVQIRGTGDSDGTFDALGPRTQHDVAEVLDWACGQPWSDGRLGLNGFSASAITVYNSLHLELPCVKTAVLKSGTFELYRDLLSPGGISNVAPGAVVLTTIGAPALAQGGDRLARDPVSGLAVTTGLVLAGLTGLAHHTLDDWWAERGYRGDVNHLPIMMVDGFFDVESRGAFQGYQELRGDGAHLVVVNGHDAPPGGTTAGADETKAWFDRYLLGVLNGVEDEARVKLWLADGDREDFVAGDFVRKHGSDWPIPGTRWQSLALDPARSGTADSVNDGTLSVKAPKAVTTQPFAALPSNPANVDLPNTAIIGAGGFDQLSSAFPALTDTTLAEPTGLTYTTAPLERGIDSAGPANLDLQMSSTPVRSGIWVIVSDVSPDGTPHPVATGRLSTDFPEIDRSRSLKEPKGNHVVVQPYGRFDKASPPPLGEVRRYRVEIWPIGNRFEAGHRIRVEIVGASAASLPGAPAIDQVDEGGRKGSRLWFPVLPGSNVRRALSPER